MIRSSAIFDACASAAAEAFFPTSDTGMPSHREVELVARLGQHVAAQAPRERRLLTLLFVFVELWPLVTRGRRFSRLPVARRAALVERWMTAGFYPLRLVGQSLKALMMMMYLSHPAALAALGARSACAHPVDRLTPIDRESLARAIEGGS